MGITVKKGNQLPAPPPDAVLKTVVTDTTTGKYYAASSAPGSGSADPFTVDGDFTIEIGQYQVLEYICFIGMGGAVDIKIGTTQGGDEIKTLRVTDNQPVMLNTFFDVDTTVYITNVPAGTLIKTKLS